MKKQKSIKKRPVAKAQAQQEQHKEPVIITNGHLLQDESLIPLSQDYKYPDGLTEKRFKNKEELEQLVIDNHKHLFGQFSFLIRVSVGTFGSGALPNIFILDIGNTAKPRVYILDIAQEPFYQNTFARISKTLLYLLKEENMAALMESIIKDKQLKSQTSAFQTDDFEALIHAVFSGKIGVLLISNHEMEELKEVTEVYDTWKMVKNIIIKKYSYKTSTYCTINPAYHQLHVNGKRVKAEGVTFKEEDHLNKASKAIKTVYEKIKSELLKTNPTAQLNPQRYYISLKNDRNVAFFHVSKKSISLVVKHPEAETKKVIKHHEIRSLTEKVQKFWGAASCTIVIENEEKINEVIVLLRKILKG